ncbi:Uma2 family endonuclease [Myxococcus sp. CA040A]|uniref:Uma2 family endonuclease n=2 Tax=Myxococcaceae TaxID=31 RepID=A0A540WPC5_9BACT|nr:Uma2 family endonuclease [Myxococcus sp. CA040A]TQF10284.1 Uma2 family endonuclease [Myxococcus llanfairpwllgwyngyllgogerychwyrndrobwllllantysiliogogogochensis]
MGRHADRVRGDAFPRAPTQEAWDAMGPEERAQVVESLPAEVTYREMSPPEGDLHQDAKHRVLDVLRHHFRHRRRKAYVGSELPVYYPGERRFAPDLLVVFDVEPHPREKWLVSHEGKGLDWVMEVHSGGNRKKDAVVNVERNARLGIREYFIYDAGRERLEGFRLKSAKDRTYVPLRSKQGRFTSKVLGLEFEVRGDKMFLWAGETLLLESTEMIDQLKARMEKARLRRQAEARRRRQAEIRQRRKLELALKDAEEQMAKMKAELRKLRPRKH